MFNIRDRVNYKVLRLRETSHYLCKIEDSQEWRDITYYLIEHIDLVGGPSTEWVREDELQ